MPLYLVYLLQRNEMLFLDMRTPPAYRRLLRLTAQGAAVPAYGLCARAARVRDRECECAQGFQTRTCAATAPVNLSRGGSTQRKSRSS